jgi:peptide deformylase
VKKIVEIPHEALRKTAKPIVAVDKKVIQFVRELEETLSTKRNPRGVGLAAPQVDTQWRIFCLNVSGIQTYINPVITKLSKKSTFGPDPEDPYMEGCLSMPDLYGPVPRWEWIEAEFQVLENGKLIDQKARFEDFTGRVFQHELDHLNGILFTDYSLKYDLPVYKEVKKDKFEEVDHELLKLF